MDTSGGMPSGATIGASRSSSQLPWKRNLVRGNQTGLTGDNLVSVNGAEEDGVDNRVEAPTWAPDGGSDGVVPGEESDKATVPAPEIPADSGEDKLTAAQDTSAGTRP